jgi:hypothetical protein
VFRIWGGTFQKPLTPALSPSDGERGIARPRSFLGDLDYIAIAQPEIFGGVINLFKVQYELPVSGERVRAFDFDAGGIGRGA